MSQRSAAPPATATLGLGEARRIALAAQGFDRPRPRRVGIAALRRVLHQLGLIQLDFVNVLVPAHYQVPFSRLGAYPRRLLDQLVFERREALEHWAHEASIVPADAWPLLAYRRARHRAWPSGFERVQRRHPEYAAWVLEQVRARGALGADQLAAPPGVDRRLRHSWFGTVPRAALEAHFGRGALAIAGRAPGFARRYDLAERVVPAEIRALEVAEDEGQRALLERAALACGVATAADLADYWRMPMALARPRLGELVERGALRVVAVEGWREPAYLHRDAAAPARIEAAALLSPFDPLIWTRRRVARLFGFEYRFEIFVPAVKRRWGTYVLPFLLGDRLVARADLRADRERRRLEVVALYLEPGADLDAAAAALRSELELMAGWLDLDGVTVAGRGRFARALRSAGG